MTTPLKIVFAGTPEFGLPCLDALSQENIEIQAIYTQPDRPAGRGRNLQASAIKSWAISHDIQVRQPQNFKENADIQELKDLQPDVMIVIAYGLILPKIILDIPKYGCINVHASILPKWRGASPIQHAILNGDSETGVSIMQMDVGMDTGDYYKIATTKIEDDDNAQTMHDKLAVLAIKPLIEILHNISNHPQTTKQDGNRATYAPKISKQDAQINWQQSASNIANLVRAFNPWPLAFTDTPTTRLQIINAHSIACQHNEYPGTIIKIDKDAIKVSALDSTALAITELKLPGKKTINVRDYINSNNKSLQVGMLLK